MDLPMVSECFSAYELGQWLAIEWVAAMSRVSEDGRSIITEATDGTVTWTWNDVIGGFETVKNACLKYEPGLWG